MRDMTPSERDLFRHVSADKAPLYRAVMEAFAAAKRRYLPYLRADEVQSEAAWPGEPPSLDEVSAMLAQLADWGNLEAQPDTARVSSIEDFYRARFLYRLSRGGEATETAMAAFAQAMQRRGELQTVALEDIHHRLGTLLALAAETVPDAAKVHEVLRDLAGRFDDLTENAQSFMAGIARTLELQQADLQAVLAYKQRLIDYLNRFIGDLVERSAAIARRIASLSDRIDPLLWQAANRELRDAAPDNVHAQADLLAQRVAAWRARWRGLSRWFVAEDHEPAQSGLLRAKAVAAIPQLLEAVAALNERRGGRSDRSADFRILACWFADTTTDDEAHRLWRAAFALHPARHLALPPQEDGTAWHDIPASTSWAEVPPIRIHPRLIERGEFAPRGPAPRIRDRNEERAKLAEFVAREHAEVEAARRRLANGRPMKLSELGQLDRHAFRLFLALLGEALAVQASPDAAVSRTTADGLLHVRLEPLGAESRAEIATDAGVFAGRDHIVTITPVAETVAPTGAPP